MALATYRFSPRQYFLLRYLYSTTKDVYDCTPYKNDNDTNPLDNFTTQLMQQKLAKWNKINKIAMKNNGLKVFQYQRNETPITPKKCEVNEFQEAIETDQYVVSIENDLKKEQQFPSDKITSVLERCAKKGYKSQILQIELLCQEKYSKFLETHSHFKHYLAEAIWVGGNVTESLKLFEEVYANNSFLRKKLRLTLKNLIEESVHYRSEAILINLTNFAKDLSIKYGDFFPLSCIWQVCILSDWFSDQSHALDLLENDSGLREAVNHKLQYVVVISLYNHKIEVVHRILEILIKYNMKVLYSGVLLALLDYQIHQNNLPRCLEIINWSIEHKVDISSGILRKFIVLLLSHHSDSSVKIKSDEIAHNRDYKF